MNLFFKIGLLSLFLAAAPFLSLPKQSKPASSFRVALQQEITKLDPLCSIDSASISLLYLTQEGLLIWAPSGEIELGLAESYEISPDKKHYRFVLKDRSWSDGSPITALDFETSWKRALIHGNPTPNTPFFFVFANAREVFEGKVSLETLQVKALSAHVLEIELEEPYAPFLQLLTTAAFFPYKTDPVTDLPLSSGSYKIGKFDRFNTIELIQRESAQTGPARIEFRWVPDEMSGLQLFTGDQLDFVGLPYSRIPSDLPESLHERTCSHELLASYALLINPSQPSLTSVEVRGKIADALRRINWEELSDIEIASNTNLLVPRQNSASSFSSLQTSNPDQAVEPSQEKRELILLTTMGSLNRKVAQVIHQKLLEQNIHVKIRMMDTKGYYSEMRQGNFDLCITWFSIQYPSPFSVLGRFTNQSFQRQLFPLKHPEFDRLYLLALQSTDESRTEQLLLQAEKLLIDDALCIPLFTPSSIAFVSDRWNVGFAPSGFADLLQLTPIPSN